MILLLGRITDLNPLNLDINSCIIIAITTVHNCYPYIPFQLLTTPTLFDSSLNHGKKKESVHDLYNFVIGNLQRYLNLSSPLLVLRLLTSNSLLPMHDFFGLRLLFDKSNTDQVTEGTADTTGYSKSSPNLITIFS